MGELDEIQEEVGFEGGNRLGLGMSVSKTEILLQFYEIYCH